MVAIATGVVMGTFKWHR